MFEAMWWAPVVTSYWRTAEWFIYERTSETVSCVFISYHAQQHLHYVRTDPKRSLVWTIVFLLFCFVSLLQHILDKTLVTAAQNTALVGSHYCFYVNERKTRVLTPHFYIAFQHPHKFTGSLSSPQYLFQPMQAAFFHENALIRTYCTLLPAQ